MSFETYEQAKAYDDKNHFKGEYNINKTYTDRYELIKNDEEEEDESDC